MNINGINKLDNNYYKNIVIRPHVINVLGADQISLNKTFSKSIKGLSDLQKIEKVIDYFLDNSIVSSLNNRIYLQQYLGRFIEIGSLSGKKMDIQIEKNDSISKRILNKYLSDRLVYTYNNQINYYDISDKQGISSYEIKNDQMYMSLCVNYENELLNFEKMFIKELVLDILKDNEAYIVKSHNQKYFIEFDNKIIKFNQLILPYVDEVLSKHNKLVNSNKVKQLKMEGF